MPFAVISFAACEPSAKISLVTVVVGSPGNGSPVSCLLGVEHARQLDQAAHDAGGADQAGVGHAVGLPEPQQRPQADEIEEAKLAEVDDCRGSMLARARELGLQQRDRVQIELADQAQPDPAGLSLAAHHHERRGMLVCSHP